MKFVARLVVSGCRVREAGTNLTITKKLRFSPESAARLERLAREMDMTESDVLRHGLTLVERVRRRQGAMEALVSLGEGETWTKERFRPK